MSDMKAETTTRTLVSGGINWNWYLRGEFNEQDRSVHIVWYDRWHKWEDGKHPQGVEARSDLRLIEDDKRNVRGLWVNGIEYIVTNPRNIFDYRFQGVL